MRILFLANNWLGVECLRIAKEHGLEIVCLVVAPEAKAKYRDEIVACADLPSSNVFDGATLKEHDVLERIQSLKPQLGISVLFTEILSVNFLNLFPGGCLNLHPAYLPYNRGAYPNVWPIIDGTPAGVTLHYIDTGLDTGDIISQRIVPVHVTDTGETLYRRLEQASLALFLDEIENIKSGKLIAKAQEEANASAHSIRECRDLDRIDLEASYRAVDLLNLLRARSFPPHKGAYFLHQGRKVFLELRLIEEES